MTRVENFNCLSESNGSLMRLTPMAVWGHKLSEAELKEAVRLEVKFTHSSEIVIEACFLYCLAIKFLLKGQDSREHVYL